MDSLIAAAARALARGDPLSALKLVALRNDAPGLALRGIAMAQLGELSRARQLLRAAHRGFGARERLARARCVLAEAEVALAMRDLPASARALHGARETLSALGDDVNAAHAAYVEIRALVLGGRLEEAARRLQEMPVAPTPALQVTHALLVAHVAMAGTQAKSAASALLRARQLAEKAGIPALLREVEAASRRLEEPAALLWSRTKARTLRLADIEALQAGPALLVDARRMEMRRGACTLDLVRRPVLFKLVELLARSWPEAADRHTLSRHAFRLRHADESVRARLRVEMGRLRKLMRDLGRIEATDEGFLLRPLRAKEVKLLLPLQPDLHADVLAKLQDGEAWSTSALAMALGTGQRSVQRALQSLLQAGRVRAVGAGRSRRWIAGPAPGIATLLLLPADLPPN